MQFLGRPMGIPKTGVFGLYDLIGIDLMADVLKSFIKELPQIRSFSYCCKRNSISKTINRKWLHRAKR